MATHAVTWHRPDGEARPPRGMRGVWVWKKPGGLPGRGGLDLKFEGSNAAEQEGARQDLSMPSLASVVPDVRSPTSQPGG